MKLRSAKKNSKFYKRIYSYLSLTVAVTICILSLILSVYFERIVLDQNYTNTVNNLKQTAQEASLMTITAQTFAKQIYYDTIVSKLHFPAIESEDKTAAITQLKYYRATSPFIESIYVYDSKTSTFYTSSDISVGNLIQHAEGFYDGEIVDIVHNIDRYEPLKPYPRRIPYLFRTDRGKQESVKDCYTFLLFDTLAHGSRDVIVLNISEKQMHKQIDGLLTSSESNSFIIDEQGILASNSWASPMLTDISERNYIKPLLASKKDEDYVIEHVDGRKSLVTFIYDRMLGWKYVRIIPYSEITSGVQSIRYTLILIALAILLVNLLISFALSRRLFSKIDDRLSELQALEKDKRESFNLLRDELIRDMLLGWKKYNSGSIRDKFEQLKIGLNPDGEYRVMLFKIDRFQEFAIRFSNADRQLIKFAAINISQETIASVVPNFSVVTGEDRIAVLMENDETLSDEKLSELAARIQTMVLEVVKISLSCTISTPADNLDAIHLQYDEAVEASFYRLFRGHASIVFAEETEKTKEKPYIYPERKEKQLVAELVSGNLEEVKQIFREIVEETTEYSYLSFNVMITHLTFEINGAIQNITKNNLVPWEMNANAMLENMSRVETLDELFAIFFEVLDSLEVYLNEKKGTKHHELVNRILFIIHDQYADKDLSLNAIADMLDLSPAYIGRLFKMQTGNTILNYIIEVRMAKVREMLLATDYPVGDIAERNGFANSPHFYKTFKKSNGVTPLEFRKIKKEA